MKVDLLLHGKDSPMIFKPAVALEVKMQTYSLDGASKKSLPDPALTAIQATMAIAMGGMTMVFAVNMPWSLCIGMNRNGSWTRWNKKYEMKPWVVNPADSGR